MSQSIIRNLFKMQIHKICNKYRASNSIIINLSITMQLASLINRNKKSKKIEIKYIKEVCRSFKRSKEERFTIPKKVYFSAVFNKMKYNH